MKPNRGYKQAHHLLLVILMSILLTACGGGGGGGSNPTPTTASQGVLIDAAVEGIRFETATQSGLTDATGTFSYMAGEVVEFFIGGISLGSTTGAATLTPIDLVAGAADEMNPQVTNILRFIQSLDSNSDLTDGIQISAASRTALTGQSLDFSLSTAIFETAFNSLSGAMLGGLPLATAADAQAHMRIYLDSLIGGGGSGGSQGLGSVAVTGVDASTIGLSFEAGTVTPLFTASTASVAWMGGNTNAGNVSRLGGVNVSTLNGQIFLLQYDIQDYRVSPATFYSYSLSCWPVSVADCNKITFDVAAKRLVLNNVGLPNRTSVVIDNQATGPITLNGTLYWE